MADDDLLKKILGKKNQNNNECYNKTRYAIIPKQTFTGKEVVQLGMHNLLARFTQEWIGLLKILDIKMKRGSQWPKKLQRRKRVRSKK